jgi:hypothetical protein
VQPSQNDSRCGKDCSGTTAYLCTLVTAEMSMIRRRNMMRRGYSPSALADRYERLSQLAKVGLAASGLAR